MHRLISISLALLMLNISLKVSVDFHYCKGKLAESKIVIGYGEASCGMEKTKSSCKKHSSVSLHKASCCENQLKQIKTDDFQFSKENVQFALGNIPAIESNTDVLPILQGFNTKLHLAYRIPPDITSVSLPIIGVFRI